MMNITSSSDVELMRLAAAGNEVTEASWNPAAAAAKGREQRLPCWVGRWARENYWRAGIRQQSVHEAMPQTTAVGLAGAANNTAWRGKGNRTVLSRERLLLCPRVKERSSLPILIQLTHKCGRTQFRISYAAG